MAYDVETKAAVVAALLTGQSISFVVREYGISKGTASTWRQECFGCSGKTEPKKGDSIDDRLTAYVCASLESLTAQVDQFGDKEWLAKQSASSVAMLHGVLFDKVFRLLQAIEAGADRNAELGRDGGGE